MRFYFKTSQIRLIEVVFNNSDIIFESFSYSRIIFSMAWYKS